AVYDAFIPRRIFSVNQFTFLVDGSLPMGRQHARFYEISVNPSPDACTPSCASRPMILAPQRWRLPCNTGTSAHLLHILLGPLKRITTDVHPALERAIDIGDRQHHKSDEKRTGKNLQ